MDYVNLIASILPWAGSLIPATLTVMNLQRNLDFDFWPALMVGAIVEALGFVAITTALDFYEQQRAEHEERAAMTWAKSLRMDGTFWLAVGAALFYLAVVLLVNAILDEGDIWHKITLALLSTFGVLGGLMVALRNQLGKRQRALADLRSQTKQAEVAAAQRAQADKAMQEAIALEREKAEREHAWQMEQARLQLEHDLAMEKARAEGLRKLEKVKAESLRGVSGQSPAGRKVPAERWKVAGGTPESGGESPDGSGDTPEGAESPRKAVESPRRWPEVSPDDYGWIAEASAKEIVTRYQLSGKDPQRTARQWKDYARKALENAKTGE